jgi:hypothetical protein
MRAAGKAPPEIIPLASLPLDDTVAAAESLAAYAEAGATGINQPARYTDAAEFRRNAERLLQAKQAAGL